MRNKKDNKVLADYITADNEEAVGELQTMAETYHLYYLSLLDAGFDRKAAMELVVAMQSQFLTNTQAGQDRPAEGASDG